MEDISAYLNEFRECSRHLWNTYFRVLDNVEAHCRFNYINDLLFTTLVLDEIKAAPQLYTYNYPEPFSCLRVVPNAEEVPIMINRPAADGNKYWDDPVRRVRRSDVDLRYIRFFDFDQWNYIDLKYYQVRIMACGEHLHLVDRDALLEVEYADVFFEKDNC